ncbi:chondroitinase-B domain-containing protein [Polaribacter sp. SA4-12]|uniref:chondroitinase-B domain-containing protein n=1 Tax=Polaribacter sp. SA4-12 TaxID=1312072 RepID=UPI0012F8ADDB|nr:chondroitinase-B domain-containing protein [Polaribacter sp. SA4-12]
MKLYSYQILLLFIAILFCGNLKAQTLVNNDSELQAAISNASAGSEIVLSNGVWTNVQISINKNGTAANPVILRAENVGQVFIEGNSNIQLGGNYIFFKGFVFQNPSSLVSSGDRIDPIIAFRDASNNECNNCVVNNIKIDSYNGTSTQATDTFKWVIVYGQNNEISHSSFVGKYGIGSIINDNRNDTNPDYTKIHHNYFASRTPVGVVNELNDQDAIRIGNSSTSLSDSYTEVYDNLFYDWSGEVEIISNKSGKNKYYNNTFSDYQGTLTLRHGNGSEVFNNYFFANNNLLSGGVRVIGEDHKIYNNYFEGVNSLKPSGSKTNTAGGINITNGRPDSELNGYYQVKNATIVNNTFVNCDYGVRIGTKVKSDLTLAPENIILANNIMLNTSISAYDLQTNPIGSSVSEGNINQNGNWDLTNGTNNNQTVSADLLETGTGFYRISSASAAVNSGVGNYSFLSDDILGGTRDSNFDAGAEELNSNGKNFPYKVEDVGEKIGFLSGESNRLSTSVNEINYAISGGTLNFYINSNINWTVSENADWLELNTLSGSDNETIEITASENNSGSLRTATITVSENDGTLTATIIVNQSIDAFSIDDAVSITDLTVTGVGTQDPNIPENTLDDIDDTRWSANSSDGSAYLTYDLQCKRTVTSVKIYFHKGNSRSSSFKIATSNDNVTYTDVTNVLTSSGTTVGFEDFPLPSNTEVRYVRVFGYGNSEGSGWNSYEEVQVFGDENCASLSVKDNSLQEIGVVLYPIPTNTNFLNIKSQTEKIGQVEVFDIHGKSLIKKNINQLLGKIEVGFLSSGIYIIKVRDVFSRFIKN